MLAFGTSYNFDPRPYRGNPFLQRFRVPGKSSCGGNMAVAEKNSTITFNKTCLEEKTKIGRL